MVQTVEHQIDAFHNIIFENSNKNVDISAETLYSMVDLGVISTLFKERNKYGC